GVNVGAGRQTGGQTHREARNGRRSPLRNQANQRSRPFLLEKGNLVRGKTLVDVGQVQRSGTRRSTIRAFGASERRAVRQAPNVGTHTGGVKRDFRVGAAQRLLNSSIAHRLRKAASSSASRGVFTMITVPPRCTR